MITGQPAPSISPPTPSICYPTHHPRLHLLAHVSPLPHTPPVALNCRCPRCRRTRGRWVGTCCCCCTQWCCSAPSLARPRVMASSMATSAKRSMMQTLTPSATTSKPPCHPTRPSGHSGKHSSLRRARIFLSSGIFLLSLPGTLDLPPPPHAGSVLII